MIMANKLPRSVRNARRRQSPERTPDQFRPNSSVPDEHRLGPSEARQFYLVGKAGFNRGRREWMERQPILPGVYALLQVTGLNPPKYDEQGKTIDRPTHELAALIDQGLEDIRAAGTLPLDEGFVGQYLRLRNALVEESIQLHTRPDQDAFDQTA